MKHVCLILLFFVCSLSSYAQNSFFDRLADVNGVTSVYISKAMLKLMPDMKTEGVDIGKIAGKLDNIQILSSEKPEATAKIKKEIQFINKKNGYEELMRINDEDDKTVIYLKEQDNKKEFVLINDEGKGLTVIVIVGNLTLNEMKGIIGK